MIDYWNATLTVKGIAYDDHDPDTRWHVMEPVQRRRFWPKYFKTKGDILVYVHFVESSLLENGLTEYRVEFLDQDIVLPPGTILYPCREDWMKKIPEGEVTRVIYETRTVSVEFDENDEMYFATCDHYRIEMEQCGKVTI